MDHSKLCVKSVDYVLDELNEFEEKQFQKHLSSCRRCQLDCLSIRGWKRVVEDDLAEHTSDTGRRIRRKRYKQFSAWRNSAAVLVLVTIGLSGLTLDRVLDRGVPHSAAQSVAQVRKIEYKILHFARTELSEIRVKV